MPVMTRLLMVSFCKCVLMSILLLQAESQSCNNEPLTDEDIQLLTANCTVQSCSRKTTRGFTYFFHHLTFTCNGSLVNWTASGDLQYGDVETNPTLFIWRLNPQNTGEYIISQEKIPLLQCNGKHMPPNSQQIYKCELQNGVPVQEGDVLGMEVPFYDSNSDMFNPYFDQTSEDLPRIYFRRGTTITTFVLSGSSSTRLQPLLSVDVVPDDPSSAMSTSDSTAPSTLATSEATSTMGNPKTDGTIADSRTIVIGLEEKIGIAVGALVLLVAFILLVGIQCCVIIRNRNKRKSIHTTERRESEYSAQPYAMIDMTGVDMSERNVFSKHFTRQADPNHMQISKNPSYATVITTSTTSLINNGDSMYMSAEDITLTEGLRVTLEETEQNKSEEQDLEERYSNGPSSPYGVEHDHHSTHGLTSSDSEEVNYTNIEELTRLDEMDSGIHLHQPDLTTNREENEDTSEPIYY